MNEALDAARQARLAQLRELYEEDLLNEVTYRAKLETLGIDPDTILAPPLPPAPPDVSALRQRLNRLDDPQIEALAIDHFPDIKAKFSAEMGRDIKINLLLDHCRRKPEAVHLLERWLDRQPTTCNQLDVLACYLTHVIEENARLQLQGIRSAEGLVSIALEEVFITLTATVRKTVMEQEAWVEEMAKLAPGETRRRGLERPRESVQQVKVQVQEALALHPRLVVLGDPGCGKTTLLRYLALTFARDFRDDDRRPPTADGAWVKERLGLD